jgi:hypothetical protein
MMKDPREVARWAASKTIEEHQILWMRPTLNGPGWMLTSGPMPRGGIWTRVCLILTDDAARIRERGPRGWPALCRLAEAIEDILLQERVV